MPKPKYKAVIFDFDNTLVETIVPKWAQHTHVAKKFYGIDLSKDTLREHWGKPLKLMIQELYQYRDTMENMYQAILSTREDFPKTVYPASVKIVEELIRKKIKVNVFSATTVQFVLEDLHRLNFPVSEICLIQGSDQTKVHKPDPKVFLPIFKKLREFKIQKKHIVCVGDSLDDLLASQRAKIDFIAVTTGLHSREDFKKHGAKVIVKDIKEIISKIV